MCDASILFWLCACDLCLGGSLNGRSFSCGSLLGRSLGSGSLGSLSGLLSSLSCSNLGAFLGHGLSLCLVLLGLFLQGLLGGSLLALALLVLHSLKLGSLLLLPSVETALCLCLVECALLDTTLQVLHEHDAFAAENVTDGVGGLSTNIDPIECALEI